LIQTDFAAKVEVQHDDRESRPAMTRALSHPDYPAFLAALKDRILCALISAARAVNRELVLLYCRTCGGNLWRPSRGFLRLATYPGVPLRSTPG